MKQKKGFEAIELNVGLGFVFVIFLIILGSISVREFQLNKMGTDLETKNISTTLQMRLIMFTCLVLDLKR